jgi:acetyltransferase-like isoleucine patch superfamily enzyme
LTLKDKLFSLRHWLAIFGVNFNGRIGIHSIRHPIYRHIYKIGLPKDSIIYCGCRFFDPWGVKLGNHTIVGDHAFLDGRRGLTIGNNVNIGSEVRIYTLEHDPDSPSFETKGGPVVIKDWVYIGSRVTILPGVVIEEGAVVASGAVVAKNVEPWTVVGGVPAKFIRNRPQVRYTLDTDWRALFQ